MPIKTVTTRDKQDSSGTKSMQPAPADANDNVTIANAHGTVGNDLEVVVFIVQPDNTVRKQTVKTSIQDINDIEITEGLKEGDEVVTGPYEVVSKTLKNKAKVKVVPKSELFDTKK